MPSGEIRHAREEDRLAPEGLLRRMRLPFPSGSRRMGPQWASANLRSLRGGSLGSRLGAPEEEPRPHHALGRPCSKLLDDHALERRAPAVPRLKLAWVAQPGQKVQQPGVPIQGQMAWRMPVEGRHLPISFSPCPARARRLSCVYEYSD